MDNGLFGKYAGSFYASSPRPITNWWWWKSWFWNGKIEHFPPVILGGVEYDIGRMETDRIWVRIIYSGNVSVRSRRRFNFESVFEVGLSFRSAFRIGEEYRIRTIFKIERFRIVSRQTTSRKREVGLEIPASRSYSRTLFRRNEQKLTAFVERSCIEFYYAYRKCSVSGNSKISFRNFSDTDGGSIGIIRIFRYDIKGFGRIPKSALPSPPETHHSNNPLSSIGIVVQIS